MGPHARVKGEALRAAVAMGIDGEQADADDERRAGDGTDPPGEQVEAHAGRVELRVGGTDVLGDLSHGVRALDEFVALALDGLADGERDRGGGPE